MITPALCSFGFLEMQVLGMYVSHNKFREKFSFIMVICRNAPVNIQLQLYIHAYLNTPAVDRPIYDYINLTIKSVGI